MHPILNVALRAARKAAQNITQRFDRLDLIKIEEKSHNDYVTQVDHQIERLLIEIIFQNYPTHSVLGEESGEIFGPACQDQQAEYQWIIDPIDGTTNFIFGIPHFAISIAIAKNNQVEHAVIVDPIKREEFTATLGAGAQLNGKRIRVSPRRQLEGALLATGFPFRKNQHNYIDTYLATLKNLMQVTSGIRRAGAASLDLAYVAAGRYDGYWESGLQPWDIAAGALLIQEAGGWISDFDGKDGFLKSGDVVCGSTRLQPLLLQSISQAKSAPIIEIKTTVKSTEVASTQSENTQTEADAAPTIQNPSQNLSQNPLQNRRERRALDRDRLQAKFIQRQQGKTEKNTEGKEHKETRAPREARSPKEREFRETREPRESRDSRPPRGDSRAPRERGSRDTRDSRDARDTREPREDRFHPRPASSDRPRKAPWQSQNSDRAAVPVRSKTDRPPQPRERGDIEDRYSAPRRPPRRDAASDQPEANEGRGGYRRHDAEQRPRRPHTERPEYRSSRPPSGKPRQRTRPD